MLLGLSSLALTGLLLLPQQAGGEPVTKTASTAPAGSVVVINGKAYTKDQYKDFLFDQIGPGAMELFINEQLAQQAAAKQGIHISDADAAKWAEDKAKEASDMEPLQGMSEKERENLKKRYQQIAKSGALFETLIKQHRQTEEGLKKEYEVRFGEKRQARHILVRPGEGPPGSASAEDIAAAKKKIDDIHAELKKASKEELLEAFAKAAEKSSEDPGSAERGGQLPEFARGDMVKEFADAAFSLKEMELSEPIKSDFGWHIILVTKVIPPAKAFDEDMKKELKGEVDKRPVDGEEHQRFVDDLRKDAKIERVLE
jgi:parvulin-like peptidyl-prolyl isomerase